MQYFQVSILCRPAGKSFGTIFETIFIGENVLCTIDRFAIWPPFHLTIDFFRGAAGKWARDPESTRKRAAGDSERQLNGNAERRIERARFQGFFG